MNWINLTDVTTLNEIVEKSKTNAVLIFKHSTRCSISRTALKYFEMDASALDLSKVNCYFLDLLNFREISNQIATLFNVIHESPQLMVIKDGVCILVRAHDSINALELKDFLK